MRALWLTAMVVLDPDPELLRSASRRAFQVYDHFAMEEVRRSGDCVVMRCPGCDDLEAFLDCAQTGTQVGIWRSFEAEKETPVVTVAFRGTELGEIRDVLTDIAANQQLLGCEDLLGLDCPAPGAEQRSQASVHSGFLRAFLSVREDLTSQLRDLGVLDSDSVTPVVFTGHSLGGALCVISALDLAGDIGKGRMRVVTFGSPRIGNQELARQIDATFARARSPGPLRVVTEGDIVPRVPRGTLVNRVLDYVHAGATLTLPSEDATGVSHDMDERKDGDEDSRAASGKEPTSRRGRIRVAIGDSEDCPLREADPGFWGVFPLDVRRWSPLPVRVNFIISELTLLFRVVAFLATGFYPHSRTAYFEGLARVTSASLASSPRLPVESAPSTQRGPRGRGAGERKNDGEQ